MHTRTPTHLHPILFFSAEHHFLSNFHIDSNGTHVEGQYQAAKTIPPDDTLRHMEPGQAKRAGSAAGFRARGRVLRPDWENVKSDIMYTLVHLKFSGDRELYKRLLATGDVYLREGNTWHDNYWGCCVCAKCTDKQKLNVLGSILMKVRRELRVRRGNGYVVCEECGKTASQHPLDLVEVGLDNMPYLHVMCNHERLHL